MLLDWLAFGALSSGSSTPPVFIPSERSTSLVAVGAAGNTVPDTLPIGAATWAVPLDPADHAPYVFDWSSRLGDGEKVVTVSRITVSASAAGLGVQVDKDDAHAPAIDSTGTKVSLWLDVDAAFQNNAAFSGSGIQVGIAMLVTTNAAPPRSYERTMVLTVRQQ